MTPKSKPTQSFSARLQLWVRRGALRRFHLLKRDTAHLPVTVAWDRRDPTSSGPHGEDRRAAPAFTWDAADFVVGGEAAVDEDKT